MSELVLLLIYAVSMLGAYFERRDYYSIKNSSENPDFSDVVLIFIPILNTLGAIIYLSHRATRNKNLEEMYLNFFKIKR